METLGMLATLIADDDFPEDDFSGEHVDPNADTQIMLSSDVLGEEALGQDTRMVSDEILASLGLRRLSSTQLKDVARSRLFPFFGLRRFP